MALRDRIRDNAAKAAGRAAGKMAGKMADGRSDGAAGRGRQQGAFGQGGFGQGVFGQGGFGRALEDLLAFAGDLRGQATGRMQGELERLAARLDLVTRREFEAVREIAIAARTQAERLEAQLNGGKASRKSAFSPVKSKAAPAKKPAKMAAKTAPQKVHVKTPAKRAKTR